MGRREGWPKEGSADSRTRPTRWEFSKRGCDADEKLGIDNPAAQLDNEETRKSGKSNLKDANRDRVNVM